MRLPNINLFRPLLRRKRKLIVAASVSLIPLMLAMGIFRVYTSARAQNQIYTLYTVPARPVAIVFGAWVEPDGDPSAMLADRVNMAAQLYKAGKVQVLLLSGDNHVTDYNEPEAMRQYALALGVPASVLVLDYAGFRTYDSCYRARAIFKVTDAVLVTQAFHLDRALLTCNDLGITSVGVAADPVRPEGYAKWPLLTSQLREFPSTVSALFDLAIDRKPTYLGQPLPIFCGSFACRNA